MIVYFWKCLLPLSRVQLLKERICSLGNKFFSLRVVRCVKTLPCPETQTEVLQVNVTLFSEIRQGFFYYDHYDMRVYFCIISGHVKVVRAMYRYEAQQV